MTQADFTIANQTFPNTRTELNTSLQALATNSAGNSAPSTTFPSQWHYDSDGQILYLRNSDNDSWVQILTIGATSDLQTVTTDLIAEVTADAGVTIDGVVLKDSGITVNSDIILTDGDDIIANTSDGSDNATIAIAGGGANSDGRGGRIRISGNEVSSVGGTVDIGAGNVSTGNITFLTGATERVRIHNGGVMSASAGVALGVGTLDTASNVLDDYEEGTYTVAFQAGSGSFGVHTSFDQAAYVKIGREVHVQGFCIINSESSASGSLTMTLPFAIADDIAELGDRWGSKGMIVLGSSANAGSHVLLGVSGNGAFVQIHDEDGTSVSNTAATELDSAVDFYFSFHYMTNT